MGVKRKVIFLLAATLVTQCASQANNVQTIISPFLRDCYSESDLLNRNNLPPMTLAVFLDLIRKVEDNEIGDMRQFSTAIVHLFRQDGIIYDPTATGTNNIVPFSPTGFQAYKNRLLLNKLIPSNLLHFRNDLFLAPEDKCALHFMVSSSIATQNRGDEEWTCLRTSTGPNNQLSRYSKQQNIEIFDINAPTDSFNRQIMGISNCPIETGVIATPWGEVSMGTVITGISAGLEEQNVLVTDLVTVRDNFVDGDIVLNNRYSATLSGDLAEAAIRQGMSSSSITVGANGRWNSTSARRHYFLNRNEKLELTDAEIRGGLDGLVLSELAKANVGKFPEMTLSQIIDMYYSNNGILHERRFRACNRKVLVPDIASTQILTRQTLGPAVALYHTSSLPGSTNLRGIERFVNESVNAFHKYIPQNINDSLCLESTESVIRPKINMILITEPTFARRSVISHIVEQIDVGKFGSSIMLLNSATGDIVVNKTNSVATFYEELAKSTVAQSGTLSMLDALQSLVTILTIESDTEKSEGYVGGNATVALFLSDTIPLAGNERIQAVHRANWLKENRPDLWLIFATSSASEDAVSPIIRDSEDFIPISLSSTSQTFEELKPLVNYLIQIPRRIIHPECGSQWINVNSGIVGLDDYVDADGIDFYRMMPHYFYGNSNSRFVRIHSYEFGAIQVCYSRTNNFPRRNRTTSVIADGVTCESVSDSGLVEISLIGACDGMSDVNSCSPLYISVSSMLITTEPQCKDYKCRFPNDIKYTISAQDLGCYNNVAHIIMSNKLAINIFGLVLIFGNLKIFIIH